MSAQGTPKIVWTNKFQAATPSVGLLRDGYAKSLHAVFESARGQFLELDGVTESVVWYGVPWRWTMVYHQAAEIAGTQGGTPRAFAYIIPDPARLQVCVPLIRAQVAAMPMRRFKKVVRDTIVYARTMAGVSWPTWDVPTEQAIEDLSELVKRKHRLVIAPSEALTIEA